MTDKTEQLTMSVSEAARLAGLHKNTAYALIARGELGVQPLPGTGKRILLSRAAVLRWLNGGSDSPGDIDNETRAQISGKGGRP